MKTLTLGLVAGSLLLSTAALADVPKYGDLPKGSMTTPPDEAKKPTTIPAKEKVDGFNIGAPKFDKKIPVGSRHVAVFGTASQAAAMTNGTFGGEDEGSTCFTEAAGNGMSSDEDDDDSTPVTARLGLEPAVAGLTSG